MTRKFDQRHAATGGLAAAILDSAHALVVTLDIEGRIISFNRACELLTGYQADDVIGTRIWDRLLPEEAIKPIQQLFTALPQGGEMPKEYENAWKTSDGRRPVIAWNNSVVRNVAGEIEIIVGIGVDITERRETADRLAMTADNLATAQRLAKIGSWRKTVATDEEEWSDQFYRNLGLEPGSRPSCAETLYEHIHPDDRQTVFQAARRSIKEKQPYSMDYRVIQPNGSVHAVHEENGVVLGEDGKVVALIGTMQDVTDLRETENRLQRLTTRLEFAQRTARIGNWEWDAATDRQWWSDEAYRVIGYEPGEVEATDENFFAVIHRDDVAMVKKKSSAAEKTAGTYECICRINLREGTVRIVREVGYPAYDENGKYVGQNGTIQDITERYRAEQTLAETAHGLKEAERIANLGNLEWDPESDRLTLSDQTYRLIGLEPGSRQLTNDDYLQLVHPKDRQSVADLMRQTIDAKGSFSTRYRIVRPDGGVRTVTALAESFQVDGSGQRRLKGTIQDTTEQHAARQALTETARRLNAAMRLAHMGSWEWDPESNLLKMSEETLRITGLGPQYAEVDNGVLMAMIPEEDHARVLATMHRAITQGESYTNEYHIIRANGDKRSVIEHGAASRDERTGKVKLNGTIQDITERKQAEQRIALTLRRLDLSQEAALIGNSDWDLENGEVWWSDQQYRNYGAEPGSLELSIKSFVQYLHPDDRNTVEAAIDRIMTDCTTYDQEYRVIGADGILRVLWGYSIAECDKNGKPVRLMGTTLDITGRKIADEKLRETAVNLEHSQRIAHLGSWVWYFLEDRVWLSDEFYRIYGLEIGPGTHAANAFLKYIHPDDHELIFEVQKRALSDGAPYTLEYRLLWSDGAERIVSEYGEMENDANGNPLRMRGTVQDITERKQAELVLRQTMERLREAQTIGQMGSWTWDPVADKKWWSDQHYRIFGLEPGSIELKRFGYLDYIHPDDRDRAEKLERQAERDQRPFSNEYRVILPDGTERFVSEQREWVEDDSSGKPQWRGVVQDITDRKQAELKQAEMAANLTNAQRLAHLGSWDWNIASGALYWSDETHRIFGVEQGTREPSVDLLAELVHPDDHDLVLKTTDDAVAGHKPYHLEYRIIRPDGEERVIVESGETDFDAKGNPAVMHGATLDITELKRAQHELSRLNAELEQRVVERTAALETAQEELVKSERLATLGQLTATVSHELRNPLGAMRTSMYVVEKKVDAEDLRLQAAIHRINRNITRCDQIIDELLDYTRIRDLNIQQTNIDNWLGAVLDEQTSPDGIAIKRKFSAAGIRVPADSDRLRRAFINIFENACQAATTPGEKGETRRKPLVVVETRLLKDRLDIVVSDNGPGIPGEIREKIFEPLFSTKNFGVGLGLPTVSQIMKQHGGGVTIDERRGGGAKLALWLPLAGELEIADA